MPENDLGELCDDAVVAHVLGELRIVALDCRHRVK
jgi:hypothetical protein